MNTTIIDNRGRIINTTFNDLEIGDFFQDSDEERWDFEDLICMKTGHDCAVRFRLGQKACIYEDWYDKLKAHILPLKATIKIERGDPNE